MNIARSVLRSRFGYFALRNKSSITGISRAQNGEKPSNDVQNINADSVFRRSYPEFLPDPNIKWRNSVREKLERLDMLQRRMNIDIPKFFVGSIMAVETSDPHSPGKINRFVGICIKRERCGLRAKFILRNVIDHQGVEVMYELYDPAIKLIEVLRLEKRLDDHLLYLRDALPEYSTFDVNMQAETLEEDCPVSINDLKVILNPRPWLERWERQNLRGIANIDQHLNEKRRSSAIKNEKPWEKYDLMKQYRNTIPENEQLMIYADVFPRLTEHEVMRNKNKRKRSLVSPKKLG